MRPLCGYHYHYLTITALSRGAWAILITSPARRNEGCCRCCPTHKTGRACGGGAWWAEGGGSRWLTFKGEAPLEPVGTIGGDSWHGNKDVS